MSITALVGTLPSPAEGDVRMATGDAGHAASADRRPAPPRASAAAVQTSRTRRCNRMVAPCLVVTTPEEVTAAGLGVPVSGFQVPARADLIFEPNLVRVFTQLQPGVGAHSIA